MNKLTIISEPYTKFIGKQKKKFVLCQCECGINKEVQLQHVKNNHTKSCGCYNKEQTGKRFTKHGLRKHPLYTTWFHIKSRCYNANTENYQYYGGKGIKLYQEWINNFIEFYNWAIKNGWQEGLTIDRKNNNGNYEPENCRFVTWTEQANNKTSNKQLTIFNETKNMKQWSKDQRCQVCYSTLRDRIKSNWDAELALTTRSKNE